jgi:putative transposase
MARTARIVVPDMSVHIVQRGHDRHDCFFDEADYLSYLDLLSTFASHCACSVHAYCLMSNHVHVFLTPRAPDACARLMKNIGQRYVQKVNARLGRSGTLWEGRYYSCLVPGERYALACYRYVERNPVRPGMVTHPAEYRWSSYSTNSLGGLQSWMSPHAAYLAISEDPERRAATYRALCAAPLSEETLADIRKATRRGYAIGTRARPRGRPCLMRKMGSVPN